MKTRYCIAVVLLALLTSFSNARADERRAQTLLEDDFEYPPALFDKPGDAAYPLTIPLSGSPWQGYIPMSNGEQDISLVGLSRERLRNDESAETNGLLRIECGGLDTTIFLDDAFKAKTGQTISVSVKVKAINWAGPNTRVVAEVVLYTGNYPDVRVMAAGAAPEELLAEGASTDWIPVTFNFSVPSELDGKSLGVAMRRGSQNGAQLTYLLFDDLLVTAQSK